MGDDSHAVEPGENTANSDGSLLQNSKGNRSSNGRFGLISNSGKKGETHTFLRV